MLRLILLVGIGGGVGSVCRYLMSVFVSKYVSYPFPTATFIVNVLGSFIIGILIGILDKQLLLESSYFKHLLIIGFCGGFTTFSAFSLENINLLQQGNFVTAFAYILLSIAVSMLAVGLGMYLMMKI